MTDTTTTATPAANSASDSGAASSPQVLTNAPAQAAASTEPSSSTNAAPAQAAPTDGAQKDSADPAAQQPKADTDEAKPADQTSDDPAKDTDEKDADGKEKEDGTKEAQIEYQPFEMPQGMELDAEALNEATPIFKELNATQEQAQKMVNVAASLISKAAKQMADQHNAVLEGWKKESTELFGKDGEAKMNEKFGRAEKVVKHFFKGDDLNLVTHYGLGNNKAFISMCLAIAQGTGEDRPSFGAARAGAGPKTLAQSWYPDT
jgi:hypothetical protein